MVRYESVEDAEDRVRVTFVAGSDSRSGRPKRSTTCNSVASLRSKDWMLLPDVVFPFITMMESKGMMDVRVEGYFECQLFTTPKSLGMSTPPNGRMTYSAHAPPNEIIRSCVVPIAVLAYLASIVSVCVRVSQ